MGSRRGRATLREEAGRGELAKNFAKLVRLFIHTGVRTGADHGAFDGGKRPRLLHVQDTSCDNSRGWCTFCGTPAHCFLMSLLCRNDLPLGPRPNREDNRQLMLHRG